MSRKAREGIEQGEFYPEPWFVARRWWMRLLYRGLLGRPMDGRRWSDSTFWRSATRGEDHWWLRLAGWQRALIRVSALYLLLILAPALALIWSAQGFSSALIVASCNVVAAAALWSPVLTYRALRSRGLVLPWPQRYVSAEDERSRWKWVRREVIAGRERWLNTTVRPVARTVAAKLNRRYHPLEAAQWVSVPRDFREPGGGAVEILLPQSFQLAEAARRTLAKAAGERLGMRDPQFSYELEGNAPRLLLTAPALPPEHVSYADMLPAVSAAEEYTFVLGMAGSEALSISLKEDSPHLALSAGSGAGKSELIKTLVAQALHWGWFVLMLDWKGESQEWAEGLRGVRYVRDIADLHDACVSIGEEVDWRTAHRSPEHKERRRKMLIVSEEWGITAPLLTAYWSNLRSLADPDERRTMPLRSPANEALMKLNFTGRSLGMTQLLVAQRFSARVTNGNADLRESFSTILLSRWKAQTFKMLAPDVRPIPKKLTKPGQWLAVTGDEAVRFQGGLWSDEEAKEWATSGQEPPMSPWSERWDAADTALNVQAAHAGSSVASGRHETPPLAIEAAGPRLRKLSDMSDSLNHLGITHHILRNAARLDEKGDPNFPKMAGGSPSKGYLYNESEVLEWARRRRAEEQARREVA